MKNKKYGILSLFVLISVVFSGCVQPVVEDKEEYCGGMSLTEAKQIAIASECGDRLIIDCLCPEGYVLEGDSCNPECYYSEPKCLQPSISCEKIYICNEDTGTYWIDLDIEKEGCNPACVINVETKEAEINWRCTGVLLSCASEGEAFSSVYEDYPDHCCEGLTEWHSGMDTSISIADECYQTGRLAGSPVGTCINCGNGICEDIENPCNCPDDCLGKNKSDFLSVEDFCQSEDWTQIFSEACQEGIIRDFPLCKLC